MLGGHIASETRPGAVACPRFLMMHKKHEGKMFMTPASLLESMKTERHVAVPTYLPTMTWSYQHKKQSFESVYRRIGKACHWIKKESMTDETISK